MNSNKFDIGDEVRVKNLLRAFTVKSLKINNENKVIYKGNQDWYKEEDLILVRAFEEKHPVYFGMDVHTIGAFDYRHRPSFSRGDLVDSFAFALAGKMAKDILKEKKNKSYIQRCENLFGKKIDRKIYFDELKDLRDEEWFQMARYFRGDWKTRSLKEKLGEISALARKHKNLWWSSEIERIINP